MSGTVVRRQFIREFRNLRANSRLVAGFTVASYFLQVLAAVCLGYWLLRLDISAWTAIGIPALMLFIGTRLRGFNNIVHECCHFTFSERRADNVLFGSICAAAILGSFRSYREEHMSHHAHLGDYEHDRDLQRIRELRLEEPLTPSAIARHALRVLSGRHLRYYLSVNLSAQDGRAHLAMKLGLIAAAVLFLAVDPVPALLMVWIPFVWVFTALNYLADCIDHGGLVGADDELDSSRNMPVAKPFRFFLFPRNDCFHLVHHLFPQVPARHLDECHARLMANPDYRARTVPASGRGSAAARGPAIRRRVARAAALHL